MTLLVLLRGGKSLEGMQTKKAPEQPELPDYSTKYLHKDLQPNDKTNDKKRKKDVKGQKTKVKSIYGYQPRILSSSVEINTNGKVHNSTQNYRRSGERLDLVSVSNEQSNSAQTRMRNDVSEPSSNTVPPSGHVNSQTAIVNDTVPFERSASDSSFPDGIVGSDATNDIVVSDATNGPDNNTQRKQRFLKRGESRSSEQEDLSDDKVVFREDTNPDRPLSSVLKDNDEALF